MAESAPAPFSTNTSIPARSSSRTPSGVSATRCSAVLISFGTPTLSTIPAYGGAGSAHAEGALHPGVDVELAVEGEGARGRQRHLDRVLLPRIHLRVDLGRVDGEGVVLLPLVAEIDLDLRPGRSGHERRSEVEVVELHLELAAVGDGLCAMVVDLPGQ